MTLLSTALLSSFSGNFNHVLQSRVKAVSGTDTSQPLYTHLINQFNPWLGFLLALPHVLGLIWGRDRGREAG